MRKIIILSVLALTFLGCNKSEDHFFLSYFIDHYLPADSFRASANFLPDSNFANSGILPDEHAIRLNGAPYNPNYAYHSSRYVWKGAGTDEFTYTLIKKQGKHIENTITTADKPRYEFVGADSIDLIKGGVIRIKGYDKNHHGVIKAGMTGANCHTSGDSILISFDLTRGSTTYGWTTLNITEQWDMPVQESDGDKGGIMQYFAHYQKQIFIK